MVLTELGYLMHKQKMTRRAQATIATDETIMLTL